METQEINAINDNHRRMACDSKWPHIFYTHLDARHKPMKSTGSTTLCEKGVHLLPLFACRVNPLRAPPYFPYFFARPLLGPV